MPENNAHAQLNVGEIRKVIDAALLTTHEVRANPGLEKRIEIERELRAASSVDSHIMRSMREFRYDQIPLKQLRRAIGEYGDMTYFYSELFLFGRMGNPFKQQPLYDNYEIMTSEYLNDLYTGKLKVKDELKRLDPNFPHLPKQKGTHIKKSITNLSRIDSEDYNNDVDREVNDDINNQEMRHDIEDNNINDGASNLAFSKVNHNISALEPKTQDLDNNASNNQVDLPVSLHPVKKEYPPSELHADVTNGGKETTKHIMSPIEDDTIASQQEIPADTILKDRTVDENKLPPSDSVKNNSDNGVVNEESHGLTANPSIVSTKSVNLPGGKNMNDDIEDQLPIDTGSNDQHTKITNNNNPMVNKEFNPISDNSIGEIVLPSVESRRITEPTGVVHIITENGNKSTESIITNRQIHEESKKINDMEVNTVLSDSLVSHNNNNNSDVTHPTIGVSTEGIPPNVVGIDKVHLENPFEENDKKVIPGPVIDASQQTGTVNKKRKAEETLERENKKAAIVNMQDSVLDNIKNSTMAFQSLLGDMRRVNGDIGNGREQGPEIYANGSYSHSDDSSNSGSRRNSYADDKDDWSYKQDDDVSQNTDDNDSVIEAGSNSESENIEIERLPKALKRMNDLAKKYGLYE